jgi:hypothetical protein
MPRILNALGYLGAQRKFRGIILISLEMTTTLTSTTKEHQKKKPLLSLFPSCSAEEPIVFEEEAMNI